MQTFLPYESFSESAKCLDNKRLGKQRVEAYQILKILSENKNSGGWVNHPAVKMWRHYELALSLYGLAVCQEWFERGFKDTLGDKFTDYYLSNYKNVVFYYPWWYSLEEFHSSHRAALLYKNYDFYKQFGWKENPATPISIKNGIAKLPYYWPQENIEGKHYTLK